MALNQLKYSVANLYLFPVYPTREDYKTATGLDAPEWNPYRQPKKWFDPNAKQSSTRRMVYECAFATDPDTGKTLVDANGLPKLDALVLDRDEAATVNIPPTGEANVPGASEPEIPVPMRPLDSVEQFFLDFGGLLLIKNTAFEAAQAATTEGFTLADRDLLQRVVNKLGA